MISMISSVISMISSVISMMPSMIIDDIVEGIGGRAHLRFTDRREALDRAIGARLLHR